jgi:hypothetical protein
MTATGMIGTRKKCAGRYYLYCYYYRYNTVLQYYASYDKAARTFVLLLRALLFLSF